MAVFALNADEVTRIDASLRDWRQGDLALDETWFVHVGNGASPLTEVAAEAPGGVQALTSEVHGLVVVTQTCDVVRSCSSRPYIEVAPLVPVDQETWHQVKRGRRPAYATLPALEKELLVADLDRVMTVEKSIVTSWQRTPGFTLDEDGRAFAQALARKRVRFAFPDDFTAFAKKLQSRLGDKHDKETDEGRGLRALREIRVCASPSWEATAAELFFWFIRDDADVSHEGKSWAELLREWLKLVPASGRFASVEGQVVTLADMTGEDYVMSDPLDLDHLSVVGGR